MNKTGRTDNSKDDRRVKYTKMVLRQSLLALLKEKPINKITVKELCDMSDINRGTFYTHYYDVYDLLERIENELMSMVKKAVDSSMRKMGNKGFMREILQVISDNSDICVVLFGKYGNSDFLKKIIYIAKDSSVAGWSSKLNAPPEYYEYIYTFLANGVVGILQSWVLGGLKEPTEKISQLIENLNDAVVISYKWQNSL